MDPVAYHRNLKGKIEVISRASITTREDLALAYTPGVAEACTTIKANPNEVYELTRKNNLVAVVTDGSAVLGLGNIGPEASLPVMEGKCALFKTFADVDAFPIALKTNDVDEIVRTIELISPMFGGINLEDISAPRCFEIERRLQEKLNIPVFHDDQHGTAIVVLAGLYNALKVVGKKLENITIVVNGAGAAGHAIAELLIEAGAKNMLVLDSKGILSTSRTDLDSEKLKLVARTNKNNVDGNLKTAIKNADVFIGVSKGNLVTSEMVATMNKGAVVFAMANPTPEILPDAAKQGGAVVVATGRSDFANQVNNVLVFPGIFRGLLDARIKKVTLAMQLNAAKALADYVHSPSAENILPSTLDKNVAAAVARAITSFAFTA